MRAVGIWVVLMLAACDPHVVFDKAMARTAESVIAPVTGAAAARCIVDNATPDELRAIAADVGVEAGSSTVADIMAIARRPGAAACIVQAGGMAHG